MSYVDCLHLTEIWLREVRVMKGGMEARQSVLCTTASRTP